MFAWLSRSRKSYKEVDNLYYHESGHAIVATIFHDVFIIRYLTANKDISSRTLGGLEGTYRRQVFDKFEHDRLILIFLAGICTEDINNTNGRITESMYAFEQWTLKVDRAQYIGDKTLILDHYDMIKNDLKIILEEYMVTSMRFLHCILNDKVVWHNVCCVAKALKQSPNKTLQHHQIVEIVVKEGLDKWIRRNIDSIVKQRRQVFVQ